MSKLNTTPEFFINMKDVPKWDSSKHYYDQKKHVIDFYTKELDKIKNGITIGGFKVSPWLYFHVNFFQTPIPQPDKTEPMMNPPLDDNIFYTTETYSQAEADNKGMLLFGTRGFTKSTLLTSNIQQTNIVKENGVTSVVGGDVTDLKAIESLLLKGLENIHPAFSLPRIKTDLEEGVIDFGLTENTGKKILHSSIFITNANKGRKGSSEKGAGPSPVGFIIDEIGKFSFSSIWESAEPSFRTPYGYKLVPILSGTGGNKELSQDAQSVLQDPEAYNMLMMNWDTLGRHVPEEAITWKNDIGKKFCMFVPGQMSYRLDVLKKPQTLASYLNKKNSDLEKITINVTDWLKATQEIKEDIARQGTEKKKLRRRMYYPTTIDDCFLTDKSNPFPTAKIRQRIKELEDQGLSGKNVELFNDGSKIRWEFSVKDRAEIHHKGGEADTPIVMFVGDLPENKPARYEFVSGLDGYKLDVSETDSLGSHCVIRRRNLEPNSPFEKIIMSYSARPDTKQDFHKNCEKIDTVWNSECLMEGIDTSYQDYLEMKRKHYEILAPAISFSKSAQKGTGKPSGKFGMMPTTPNNTHRFNLAVAFTKEEHVVGFDEEGVPVVMSGVDAIDDVELLKELLNWYAGGNFDRYTAWSHALVHARELDKHGVLPKRERVLENEIEDYYNRQRMLKTNKYGVRKSYSPRKVTSNKYGYMRKNK